MGYVQFHVVLPADMNICKQGLGEINNVITNQSTSVDRRAQEGWEGVVCDAKRHPTPGGASEQYTEKDRHVE